MAIPFLEPQQVNPDQVDGNGEEQPTTSSGAGSSSGIATGASVGTNTTHPSPTVSKQQVKAWKILAMVMCKAFKEYYTEQDAIPKPINTIPAVLPFAPPNTPSPEADAEEQENKSGDELMPLEDMMVEDD